MDLATIISLVNTTVLAVWIFYSQKFWPAQQQQRELDQAFNQKTRGEAFTQVLEINRNLVNNLIERSQLEVRISAIDVKIDALTAEVLKLISKGAEGAKGEASTKLLEAVKDDHKINVPGVG